MDNYPDTGGLHEVGHESRPELVRGLGHGADRDRERDAGDRDHRAGDGLQYRTGAVGLTEKQPSQRPWPELLLPGAIDPDTGKSETDGGGDHGRRNEPIAAEKGAPQPDE